MRRFIKKLFEIYKPFKKHFLVILAFIAANQVMNLAYPYLFGKVVDHVFTKQPLSSTFAVLGLAFVIYIIQDLILQYRKDIYNLKHIEFALNRQTAMLTNQKIFELSIGQHVSEHSGVKKSVISSGQSALTSMVYSLVEEVVPMFTEVILIIGALIYLSPILGLIVLAGISLFVASTAIVNWRSRSSLSKIRELFIESDRFGDEALRNAELVIANGQEKRMIQECDESIGKAHSLSQAFWLNYAKKSVYRYTLVGFTRYLVMAVGIFLVYRGDYTPGYLVVFWSWSSNAFGRIGNFGSLQRRLIKLYASVDKFFEFLDVRPDVKVTTNPIRPDRFAGRIEFRNVTLSYRGRSYIDQEGEIVTNDGIALEPALKNVSFTIEPGETVAIVGESGSGKTTTVNALLRAQDPEAGQILIDGHDLRLLDLHRFRTSIGLVEQFVDLFDNSLRYNITFGLNGQGKDITEERLRELARITTIDRFFYRLEKGFDTVVGERGIKLSGGECQRVGIARALIKDPAIFIFDEATSNIDAENESLIWEAIEGAAENRTTIIIAHRFSTIRKAKKIIVLAKGEVVGIGSHEFLSETCPAYQELIRHQTVLV
jgi:ABC-type multidrug transport system fused ATPase/permease subunit